VVLGCGTPQWDTKVNGTCSFVLNDEGTDIINIFPPYWIQLLVIVIISLSGFMTITGITTTLGRIIWNHRHLTRFSAWWARSIFRDLLADQFSWAGIVITASLAEVRDFDYSEWGAPVVAILQTTKHYVLDWFLPCDTCGEPMSVSPPLIVFWSTTVLGIIMRLIFFAVKKSHQVETKRFKATVNALLIFQALFTSSGFLLLPLTGYTVAFLGSGSYTAIASMILGFLLFVTQPIGSFTINCLVGVLSSLCVVLIPVFLSFVSGLGAPRTALLALSILSVIVLSCMDMLVLWTSFFRHAQYRSRQWRICLGATVGIRVASGICGLVFFIMLAFQLGETTSIVASSFWFAWILLPWFGLVTLIVPIPRVLSRPGEKRQKKDDETQWAESMKLMTDIGGGGGDDDVALVKKGGVHQYVHFEPDDGL